MNLNLKGNKMSYQSVELNYEPEKICTQITDGKNRKYSEMTLFQQAFLCGLLKEKRPNKIVELGVSAGGTTAIILTCLKEIDCSCKMYSVDISEKWYRTNQKDTGFVAKEFMHQIVGKTEHKFVLGQEIAHVIDEIGDGIDFLILDTTHSMPGEYLDFLVCLPYLKEDCVVVLHDVIENHVICRDNEIATNLLFQLVQGNKWYMKENGLETFGFSNIAAVEVKKQQNMDSLFGGLSFSWLYMLKSEKKYMELIEKHYGEQYLIQFKNILALQKYTNIRKCINAHYNMDHDFLRLKWKNEKNVFLYGAGYWAEIYSEYAKINNLSFIGYVISDEQQIVDADKPVYKLKDLPYSPEDCSFILALDRKHFSLIRKNLVDKGYYKIL